MKIIYGENIEITDVVINGVSVNLNRDENTIVVSANDIEYISIIYKIIPEEMAAGGDLEILLGDNVIFEKTVKYTDLEDTYQFNYQLGGADAVLNPPEPEEIDDNLIDPDLIPKPGGIAAELEFKINISSFLGEEIFLIGVKNNCECLCDCINSGE